MLTQTVLLVLLGVKLIDAAAIGIWSTSTCSGSPDETYTVFNDVCTASVGTAITVASCSDSNVRVFKYADSSTEKIKAPKCGAGAGAYIYE